MIQGKSADSTAVKIRCMYVTYIKARNKNKFLFLFHYTAVTT